MTRMPKKPHLFGEDMGQNAEMSFKQTGLSNSNTDRRSPSSFNSNLDMLDRIKSKDFGLTL